ncbi:carboxylating nicotinate-nucleotide diphosphorylase [SAR86 cluster bacterium]|jgi:nicotinate-nucleotide pyrophosphorylase (carboxylating)|nr:carboxylating nicotinate-nucleotide diphosphorylase [SAR86 cluster bacterium]
MNLDAVKKNVRVALKEDSVRQDLSIKAITKFSKKIVSAELIIREKAIISGKAWLEESFKQIDPAIKISWRFKEGKEVPKNSIVAKITGNPKAILSAERTALNFLQFMSGISTKTALVKSKIKNKKIKLLDTRKTIPGMRAEQKYATKVGGATNHRFDLSDGLMIKDNHIFATDGLNNISFKKNFIRGKFLEIEVKKLSQLKDALRLKPDVIMLDNFSKTSIEKALKIINAQTKIEISGIKNESHLKEVSNMNVDFISLGDLTKNIKAIDFSLNFIK